SEVRALAFANPSPASGPALVTAGIEWNEKGEYFGAVRVFDVATGKELAARTDLPSGTIPPGLAAHATGADRKGLRVVVNWTTGKPEAGKLLVWDDPGAPGSKSEWLPEGAFNASLAVRVKAGAVAEVITGGFNPKRGGELTVRGAALDEPTGKLLPVEN